MSRLADCRGEFAPESDERALLNEGQNVSFADVSPTVSAFVASPSTASSAKLLPHRRPMAEGESSGHTERSGTSAHANESRSTRPVPNTFPAIAESDPVAAATLQAVDARRSPSTAFARRAFAANQVCCDSSPSQSLGGLMPGQNRFGYACHFTVWPRRRARLERWAADAELTPASAGAVGVLRLRMHSTQFVRWTSSPSGLS